MHKPTTIRSFAARVLATILGCLCMWQATPAAAYNPPTHSALASTAFNVMRLVAYQEGVLAGQEDLVTPTGETLLWEAPTGVDPNEWREYMQTVADSTYAILGTDAGLGSMGQCHVSGSRMVDLERKSGLAGDQDFAAGFVHDQQDNPALGCSYRSGRKASALFARVDQSFGGRLAASALGAHAASPDDEIKDWGLVFSPDQVAFLGKANQILDAVNAFGIAITVAPFVCAWRWIHGDKCSRQSVRDFSDAVNLTDNIRGLIPSILAPAPRYDRSYTGLGHFFNLAPNARASFDDVSGMQYDRGGWRGNLSRVDFKLMLAADLGGLVVEPRHSKGVEKYEIEDSETDDGHPHSTKRVYAQWRASTYFHVQFTPLDNLAYYGWSNARGQPSQGRYTQIADLSYPLHAFGDIAAPHHLVSATGWGHRSYEDAVQQNWNKLQSVDSKDKNVTEQYQAARELLLGSFYWRKKVLDWRRDHHPAVAKDVPVRDLITEMGFRNYSYIIAGDENTYGAPGTRVHRRDLPQTAFAYNDDYRVGVKKLGDSNPDQVKHYIDTWTPQMSHLLNNSLQGTLAFLAAAGETMLPGSCADGMFQPGAGEACDDGNSTNGDGCTDQCQKEAGWSCNSVQWPSVCERSCGNGKVKEGEPEACDDGNLNNGDGCNANCELEVGWNCSPASPDTATTCTNICGDTIKVGPEDCDDGPNGSTTCNPDCTGVIF